MTRIPFCSFFVLLVCGLLMGACSHREEAAPGTERKPRLLVLLSFDQMRGDYPERWQSFWGEEGFGRMLREGHVYPNCYYEHAHTATGPGHAILATGAYPYRTGIPGNSFYDREYGRKRYCVEDTNAPVPGARSVTDGRSPLNLTVPALGDALKERYPQAKVVSISLKDRSAVIMGGHKPDAAVWLDRASFRFTTSAYYGHNIPVWASHEHPVNLAKKLAGTTWRPFLDTSRYSVPDSGLGEGGFPGGSTNYPHVFPPDSANSAQLFSALAVSPWSAAPVFETAIHAVAAEKLGSDNIPDLLCVSISNTDYVGHNFGPDSRELLDTYLLCDTLLARFITYLDSAVGREHYVIGLSADHGVGRIPEQAAAAGLDAGRIDEILLLEDLHTWAAENYVLPDSLPLFEEVDLPDVFFNERALAFLKVEKEQLVAALRDFLSRRPGIAYVLETDALLAGKPHTALDQDMAQRFVRSIWPGRSGDAIIVAKEHWLISNTPATHGSPWSYDRHVPLIFFGGAVSAGLDNTQASPADLAPTLGAFLGLHLEHADGKVLSVTPR